MSGRPDLGTYEFDAGDASVSLSAALRRIAGTAEATLTIDAFLDLVHADDRARVRAAMDASDASTSIAFVCRFVRASGETRRTVHRSDTIRDAQGQPLRTVGMVLDVTCGLAAWEAVDRCRDDAAEFAVAFRGSPIALVVSSGTRILDVNDAFIGLTGWSRDEAVGRLASELGAWETLPRQELVSRYRADGQLDNLVVRFRRKDRGTGLALLSTKPVTFDGRPATVSALVDATSRHDTLARLVESEERLRRLSDASLEGLVFSERGRIIDCNSRIAGLLGYTIDEMRGREITTLVDGSTADHVRRQLDFDTPTPYITRVRHRDGSILTFEASARVVSRDGRPIRITALRDLSERERAEKALRALHASEERFRQLAETNGDGVVLIEAGRIVYANETFTTMAGRETRDVVGTTLSALSTPEYADVVRYMNRHGVDDPYIIEMRRPDGRAFMAEVTVRSFAETDRHFQVATVRDITVRKRAEERRRALVAGTAGVAGVDFFHSLVRHLADAFQVKFAWVAEFVDGESARLRALSFWKDRDYAEPFDCELAGTPSEQVWLHGTRLFPRDLQALFPADATLGEWNAVGYFAMPLVDSDGRRTGIVAVMDDRPIDPDPDRESVLSIFAARASVELQRLRAEAEVRRLNSELETRVVERTAQLEAANRELEAFSSSVSHDLRAPLRHISGFSKLLEAAIGSQASPEALEHLAEIGDAADRMATLIDTLLKFSRIARTELAADEVQLGALVEGAVEELSRDAGDRDVFWQVGSFPAVRGDRALLRQVILNLLGNAMKYTRPRARARIEVGALHADTREVVCFVRDNGVGFDMRYASKLFGVFQRLHASSEFEGTGIGLANVHRIVTRHGGRVWAEGQPGEGATFFFALPRFEGEPAVARPVDDRHVRVSA